MSYRILPNNKRLISRKNLENAHIRAIRERCLNLNEGIGVTDVYGKGNWLRRGREEGLNEEKQTVFTPSGSVVT